MKSAWSISGNRVCRLDPAFDTQFAPVKDLDRSRGPGRAYGPSRCFADDRSMVLGLSVPSLIQGASSLHGLRVSVQCPLHTLGELVAAGVGGDVVGGAGRDAPDCAVPIASNGARDAI